jgi:hypothetical protein
MVDGGSSYIESMGIAMESGSDKVVDGGSSYIESVGTAMESGSDKVGT